MKWIWFPISVVATSAVLVVALAAFFAPPVRAALAGTLGMGGPAGGVPWMSGWHGGPWAHGSDFALPPELQGLASIPPDQRFSHFLGAQINVKDKDGRPLTISATPGTVATASATSLTLTANDGTSKTFTLDSTTMIHGKAAPAGTPTASTTLQNGDEVVVIMLSNRQTATAVIVSPGGSGWFGPGGRWGLPGTRG